jgi:S-adenosylmethionine:tRNA ribosyltransferase-isomerase
MHPASLSIQDFTYHLPEEKIARYPLAERDQSKLLVYKNGHIEESTYSHIADFISAGSLLIFNNTKVVEARLLFQKETGGTIEIFCLAPSSTYADITTAMLQTNQVQWVCMVGGAKKWKDPLLTKKIITDQKEIILTAKKIEQRQETYIIELSWDDDSLSFAALLHIAGLMPLPPYLNRPAEESDKERYQTIYAENDGSVAAPTAGLHFTEKVFNTLSTKNIAQAFVTLHVGAGTFKPVKAATMQDHDMHVEFIEVDKKMIQQLLVSLQHDIICVGTTSLRTVESIYWLGVKTIIHPAIKPSALMLNQWDPYELAERNISASDSLIALLQWLEKNKLEKLISKTQIIIAPGYTFKLMKALVTNFHQPQSTLLLLVAAIVGNEWKTMYQYALNNDFRLLSYGDGSLIWHD